MQKQIQSAETSHKRKFLLVGGLLVLVLACGVTWSLIRHTTPSKVTETTVSDNKKKADTVNNGGAPAGDNEGSTQSSTPYTPPADNTGITITPSQSNDQVVIKTLLKGYSDGTCTLTITNDARTTSQTVQVIFAPDASTCAGFTVPVSTIGAGSWNINLDVMSGGKTTSKAATLEVN